MWLFNNAVRHNEIIYGNDNAASISTQITKVT